MTDSSAEQCNAVEDLTGRELETDGAVRSLEGAPERQAEKPREPLGEVQTERRPSLESEIQRAGREAKRREELLEYIKRDYRVVESSYFFKDRQAMLAFLDKGTRLVTSHNDERVAFAMAMMR